MCECVCSQEQLSVQLSQTIRSSCEMAQLRRAEWRRDTLCARDLWRSVCTLTFIHIQPIEVNSS